MQDTVDVNVNNAKEAECSEENCFLIRNSKVGLLIVSVPFVGLLPKLRSVCCLRRCLSVANDCFCLKKK